MREFDILTLEGQSSFMDLAELGRKWDTLALLTKDKGSGVPRGVLA